MNVTGKTAFITGAGSGIGRGIALSMGRCGCHLALADINPAALEETAGLARASGVRVSVYVMDVRNQEAVKALPAQIQSTLGSIDILVNNAGVAAGGTFLQVSEEVFDRVIDINFLSVVRITRAFLPLLLQRPEARIVNISSVYGLISTPEQTAYAASKFAVRGFSNVLRHELENSTVGVTVVHPGGISTNIARDAAMPESMSEEEIRQRMSASARLLRMPPERAGEIIVKAIRQNKARVLVGIDARIISLVERLMPVHYWNIFRRLSTLAEPRRPHRDRSKKS